MEVKWAIASKLGRVQKTFCDGEWNRRLLPQSRLSEGEYKRHSAGHRLPMHGIKRQFDGKGLIFFFNIWISFNSSTHAFSSN